MKFSGLKYRAAIFLLAGLIGALPISDAYSQNKGKKQTATGKSSKNVTSASAGKGKKNNAKTETVSDVKRQEGAVQKEIAATKTKIKENEQAVKQGLAELNALQGEITEGKKKLDQATRQVNELSQKISEVEGDISKGESELKKLREEYLKAVKKIRVKKKTASTLSFLFSSKTFSEAMRRMRYLREFSDWRKRQSDEIGVKVAKLKEHKELLARTRTEKDAAMREESRLQSKLQTQYKEQDAMVVKLKANGDALRNYLAQKQAEANTLKNRVSALIAEEQRREAERKAREESARKEAARKAEEQRKQQLAREEAARKEAEAKAQRERELAEAKAKADAEARKKATPTKDNNKKNTPKKETKPKEEPKKDIAKNTDGKSGNTSYAEARKRRPRGQKDQASEKAPAPTANVEKNVPKATNGENLSKPSAKKDDGGGFASMKGSLPRPVSGSFRITSRFGRHALPDLPNVMYDNPGIDAEVASGASAQAVYAGKVSGVYVVPGYSTVVIVNHGSYYTVYGNINKSAVKVGDQVKQGQNLGYLAPDEDDRAHSTIHFEVWHNRDKMNPSEWIR